MEPDTTVDLLVQFQTFLKDGKDFFLTIPGPWWAAFTVLLLATAKFISRLRPLDNKTSLYREIKSALKEPAKWARKGVVLTSGRIILTLIGNNPDKTKGTPTKGWPFARKYVSVTINQPDKSEHKCDVLLHSFLNRRRWKLTKLAIAMWHTQVEREGQNAAGKCLSSAREVPTAHSPANDI